MNLFKNIISLLLIIGVSSLLMKCYAGDKALVGPEGTDFSGASQGDPLWPKSKTVVASDEEQIKSMLEKMSTEDKVGQLVMAEIRHVSPRDVKRYRLGGILNGGGAYPKNNSHASAADWVALADDFYKASIDRSDDGPKIPVLWGTDAVHGHNNVYGATIFPHNIGLGATQNPQLMKKIGAATAKEVAATGIYWTFAPTVTVPMDDRWGRTYEGFSEDPKIVVELSTAMIEGLQGEVKNNFLTDDRVIATAKHFIGDGGTQKGVDQGDTRLNEAALSKLHGQGYFSAMDVGVQTVMATFNSWNGKKIHGDKYLLTEVLKNKMGFDGFVVGDWNGHGQVAGCSNDDCAQAINAGVDMIMVPEDWEAFYKNTLKQVRSGTISAERLDDAVSRILRVKQRLGMFSDQGPKGRKGAGDQSVIGSAEHRAIARQAVSESLVLLKNNGQTLPLKANTNILVAGEAAESLANQLGGWSLTWQGTETKNSDFPGATLIVDAIQHSIENAGGSFAYSKNGDFSSKPDAAIVIISEPPYAEGPGDRANLAFSPENRKHIAIMKKLKAAGVPVVTIFMSGRAMWVNPELNASDAFVAAWLPGTEGQGVTDVLFCEDTVGCNFKGKSSFSWPKTSKQGPLNNIDSLYDPLFPVGYGLRYGDDKELSQLTEQVASQESSAIGSILFKGRGIPPFSAVIQENGAASMSASQSPTRTETGGVQALVFDRKLQEDAQRIQFNGKGLNSWQLESAKKLNWTQEAKQDALIAFDINVLKKSQAAIYAVMVCGAGCNGSQNITDMLTKSAGKGWQSVGIELNCMQQLGADLMSITHPLVFLTSGDWEFELSNIQIVDEKTQLQVLSCDR